MDRIFSNPTNHWAGHHPNRSLYRDWGLGTDTFVNVVTPFKGLLAKDEYTLSDNINDYVVTNNYKIAISQKGNAGIPVLKLHGVPTNRLEWIEVDLSPWCQDIAIDMLGMGDSDKPLDYGVDQMRAGDFPESTRSWDNPWDWVNDVDYIEQVMQKLHPNEQFIFVASDWGGGIATHYAAKYPDRLAGLVLIDPIALDGYPVSEIQAIGRASTLSNQDFMASMGAVDQTMVQIFKTMVYDQNKFNQYKLRDLKRTYFDVDYERSKERNGEDADSSTLRIKYHNLRVLSDRSLVLAPAQLLPISENPRGVDYDKITCPVLIMWGEQDNMMPTNQAYRLMNLLRNSSNVQIQIVSNAGHFAEIDQPDRVSENILNFIIGTLGSDNLADPFLGLTGIWKGDEAEVLNGLRRTDQRSAISDRKITDQRSAISDRKITMKLAGSNTSPKTLYNRSNSMNGSLSRTVSNQAMSSATTVNDYDNSTFGISPLNSSSSSVSPSISSPRSLSRSRSRSRSKSGNVSFSPSRFPNTMNRVIVPSSPPVFTPVSTSDSFATPTNGFGTSTNSSSTINGFTTPTNTMNNLFGTQSATSSNTLIRPRLPVLTTASLLGAPTVSALPLLGQNIADTSNSIRSSTSPRRRRRARSRSGSLSSSSGISSNSPYSLYSSNIVTTPGSSPLGSY